MLEHIKSNLNGETVLLDTSLVSGDPSGNDDDILRILYGGVRDLRLIPAGLVEQKVSTLNDLVEICNSYRVHVIKEVEEELNTGLNQLNGHVSFLKGRKKAFDKHIDKRRNRWSSDNDDRIEGLLDYSNVLYGFVRQLRDSDPRDTFDDRERELYELFFDEADRRSKDLRKEVERQRESTRKNPLLLGNKLNTDAKIVAAAFVLSYRRDVSILTNDTGIDKLARRIGFSFSEF